MTRLESVTIKPLPKPYTLILLHGAGMTPSFWHYQQEALEPEFGLFIPQVPGMLPGNLNPSMEDYADFMHQQIQQQCIDNPVLVGHSMGGAIVLQLLLKYPRFYSKALLSNTGARLKVLPALLQMLMLHPTEWQKQITGSVQGLPKEQLPQLVQAITLDPIAPLLQFQACNQFDVLDRLHEIEAEVQVVVAEQDPNTPAKYGEFLAQKLSAAKLHRLPGGHLSPFVCAQIFNQIIKDWLQPS